MAQFDVYKALYHWENASGVKVGKSEFLVVGLLDSVTAADQALIDAATLTKTIYDPNLIVDSIATILSDEGLTVPANSSEMTIVVENVKFLVKAYTRDLLAGA